MAAASEILTLIRACAAGNATARRTFQDRYGPDIYNFPVKIYRAQAERAADFYLYAFERDRIFKRLTTFEGRNSIQFRTFLGHYVLRSLFIEWQRSQHDLDAVSLSSPVGDPNDGRVLEDVLADPDTTEVPAEDGGVLAPLWTRLSPDDQLDLKLLSLLEHDLTPDDVRRLAKASGRTLRDTLSELSEVQEILSARDRGLAVLREQLDAVWGWIVLRRRELQDAEEALRRVDAEEGRDRQTLVERRDRLHQAVGKRLRQRERLLEEIREFKVTTPYKHIARLRNLSLGTVCSRVFRLRQRLAALAGDATLEEEAAS